jgi:hypothetical protein
MKLRASRDGGISARPKAVPARRQPSTRAYFTSAAPGPRQFINRASIAPGQNRARGQPARARTAPRKRCRHIEWVRRLGASLSMHMTASSVGSFRPLRIQACGARSVHHHKRAPLGYVIPATSSVVLGAVNAKTLLVGGGGAERRARCLASTASCARWRVVMRVGARKPGGIQIETDGSKPDSPF